MLKGWFNRTELHPDYQHSLHGRCGVRVWSRNDWLFSFQTWSSGTHKDHGQGSQVNINTQARFSQ